MAGDPAERAHDGVAQAARHRRHYVFPETAGAPQFTGNDLYRFIYDHLSKSLAEVGARVAFW